MIPMNARQIARYTRGSIICGDPDTTAAGVAVDSRKAHPGCIFFALPGNVTDGHKFLKNAFENGAVILLVTRADESVGACQIKVEDTLKAMQDLARAYIAKFDIPSICVTGSSGKTTTKDVIASCLSQKYNVMKTQGNLNSETGALLTVFTLMPEHEIAVFELSMSGAGEIRQNADIIRPGTAVITNIGCSHIALLGSRENIFAAKCEIAEYLTENDMLIVNADDDMLGNLSSERYGIIKTGISFGDFKAEEFSFEGSKSHFSVDWDGEKAGFTFPLPGEHNIRNCLEAICVARKYGLSAPQIQKGFDRFVPSENRMDIFEKNGVKIINDTYNANPDAMRAALDTLSLSGAGRRIAVLGDMYELGDKAAELTFGVGEYAKNKNIDVLLSVGMYAGGYLSGFGGQRPGMSAKSFADKNALTRYLKAIIKEGDTVLLKASRAMELQEVFFELKESFE